MRKVFFSFFIGLISMIFINLQVFAQSMEESTADGIIVSVGDFKENFGIAPSKQKRNIKNLEKVECEIRNIQIDKELLGLEVELKNVDDENEYISMFGNLRASYKAQNGISAEDYPEASKKSDALWATPFVEHEIKEIPADEENLKSMGIFSSAREANKWMRWVNSEIFEDSFYIGADYVVCRSLPYVDYRYSNVSSQDTTWVASFKITENMKVGNNYYYGTNVFEYRNLSIKFGCGDNTTFLRTEQQGRMCKYSNKEKFENAQTISAQLFNKAVSSLPHGSTFLTVSKMINSMTGTNKKVELGSTGMSIVNRKTVAVGEGVGTEYTFEECTDYNNTLNVGHYFTFSSVLQYEAAGGNEETVGVLTVEFDKYFTGDDSYTNIKKEIQLDYSAKQ